MNGISQELSHEMKARSYTLVRWIGSGGYSDVYEVTSDKYHDEVTLFVAKIIDQKKLKSETKAAGTFYNEIDTLNSISHPNILNIYDYFTTDHFFVLILEYCTMGALKDIIKPDELLETQKIYYYLKQMCDAIQYLHNHQIAHHDIKPANFLLHQSGRLKLGDFGITKSYKNGQLSTVYAGTPRFLAPEVLKHKPYNPFKSDIWALGVTLYYLATGCYPFNGRTHEEQKNSIMAGFQGVPPNVDPLIASIIRDCLRENPEERPTITEIQRKLSTSMITQLPKLQCGSRSIKRFRSDKDVSGPTMLKSFRLMRKTIKSYSSRQVFS